MSKDFHEARGFLRGSPRAPLPLRSSSRSHRALPVARRPIIL